MQAHCKTYTNGNISVLGIASGIRDGDICDRGTLIINTCSSTRDATQCQEDGVNACVPPLEIVHLLRDRLRQPRASCKGYTPEKQRAQPGLGHVARLVAGEGQIAC